MSDSEDDSLEQQLKFVLVGEACVGKTSLTKRFCSNEFTRQYHPTAGVDFFLKRITLQKIKNVTLKIWDVGGSSQTGTMFDKYIFGAHVIIFVYDITNEVTFHCLEDWLESVKNLVKDLDQPPMLAVLGNKCDMEHHRAVSFEKHQKYMNELNISSHIVSARTGDNVNLAFQKLVAEHLGVKLTRSQVEEYQPVVRAEISTHSELTPQMSRLLIHSSRSSVCCIQ